MRKLREDSAKSWEVGHVSTFAVFKPGDAVVIVNPNRLMCGHKGRVEGERGPSLLVSFEDRRKPATAVSWTPFEYGKEELRLAT